MKKSRLILWWVLGVLLGLIVITMIVLPIGIRAYINQQLAQNPDYSGAVGAVSVHYLEPGLSLRRLHLEGRPTTDKPILDVGTIRLLIEPAALMKGHLLMTVVVDHPDLTYIQLAPTPEEVKKPPTYIWQVARSVILPIPVNEVIVHEGHINYVDKTADPPFAMQVSHINAVLTGLQKQPTANDPLPANLGVNATTIGDGQAQLNVVFNPWAKLPAFSLNFSLEDLQLSGIGDFLEAYSDLRAKQGEFNLYVEADANQGKMNAYAKPFVNNVQLIVPKSKQGNAIQHLYKNVVQWLAHFFRNNDTQKAATKIELSGDINDPNVSVGSAIVNLLRNAFLQALLPQFDGNNT